jgi:endonuclease G
MKHLKVFLYSITLLSIATFSMAAEQPAPLPLTACIKLVPYGTPVSFPNTNTVCRTGYLLNHDPVAKIPHWVAYTLTPAQAISCLPRDDAFASDQSLPKGQRAELFDYQKSGYDQGHIANNADMSFSEQAAMESFILSNMSPQLPGLNRGVWKLLESSVRSWAYQYKHSYTVYAGDIWSASSKTIGPNKVVVPDYLYKIVIDNNTKQSIAFIFPQREGLGNNLTAFQVTVTDVEKATGYSIPVPDSKMIKNPIPATDFKTITEDKKKQCKGA